MNNKIAKIVIGSDHGGFELKEDLKGFIKELGYEVVDYGCYSEEPVDYPDIAFLVAETVATNENYFGIMIDSIGIASAMTANKVPNIRAAVCWNAFTANSSREHNDANVLTLGGRVLGKALAREIVKVWLETDYAGGRHTRRVNKIMEIENRFLKR